VGKKSSTKLRKIKKTLQQKRESINAAERKRRELQGEQVSKEALNARKRRNLSYFAIGLNDSGRAIEMDKLLAKQGKKMKTTRDDDDEDDDDKDDWDEGDLFANAK